MRTCTIIADDLPAYIVISIVGHVLVGLLLPVEISHAPPLWVHMALWIPLTLILSLGLLQPVKGVIVGCSGASACTGSA